MFHIIKAWARIWTLSGNDLFLASLFFKVLTISYPTHWCEIQSNELSLILPSSSLNPIGHYITLILFSLFLTAVFPSLHLIQSKHNSVNLISSPSISLIQDMIILWSIVCFHFLWFSTLEFNIKSTFIPSCSFLMAKLRAHLVHCNDYYIGIEISIIMNTLSWNVISITIH